MLHGEIKVNHNEIAAWRAVRKENVGGDNHVYKCTVAYRDMQGYLQEANFSVTHAFHEGALVLTSKVMAEAAVPGRMKRLSE